MDSLYPNRFALTFFHSGPSASPTQTSARSGVKRNHSVSPSDQRRIRKKRRRLTGGGGRGVGVGGRGRRGRGRAAAASAGRSERGEGGRSEAAGPGERAEPGGGGEAQLRRAKRHSDRGGGARQRTRDEGDGIANRRDDEYAMRSSTGADRQPAHWQAAANSPWIFTG